MDDNGLLTIRDLAERWGVSMDTAKRHVRKAGVPFLRIGTDADMRINWGIVRFRKSDVLLWEQESVQVFDPAEESRSAVSAATFQYRLTKVRP